MDQAEKCALVAGLLEVLADCARDLGPLTADDLDWQARRYRRKEREERSDG